MKVLFDFRGTSANFMRGIARYLHGIAEALLAQPSSVTFEFLVREKTRSPPFLAEWVTVEEAALRHQSAPYALFLIGSCFSFGATTRTTLISDLFPPFLNGVKKIGIFYDVIPALWPEHYLATRETEIPYRLCQRALLYFDHLLAISEAARADAIRYFGVSPTQISVLHGGAYPPLETSNTPSEPLLMAISASNLQKDAQGLVKGFSRYKDKYPHSKATLALVGLAHDLATPPFVRSLKKIPESALQALFQNATALIHHSLYEGLGLPILEAYRAGLPVIAAANSSLIELTHPACTYETHHIEAMADTIHAILTDDDLQQRSRQFGQSILTQFSWSRGAQDVLKAIHHVTTPSPYLPKKCISLALVTASAQYVLPLTTPSLHTYTAFEKSADFLTAKTHSVPLFHIRNIPYTRLHFTYSQAIFVFGNASSHLATLNCLQKEGSSLAQEIGFHLHDNSFHALFLSFYQGDLTQLQEAYQTYYPEFTHAIMHSSLAFLPFSGVRLLTAIQKPDWILVHSEEAKKQFTHELGSLPVLIFTHSCSLSFKI